MSKLKISENLFLDVAELNRMTKFLSDDGYKLALKSIIKKFGIVPNTDNTYFKVTKVSGNTIQINSGLAYDSDFEAIRLSENIQLNVTNTGSKRWIILTRAVTNNEVGTVTVSVDGTMSGIGTKFTEVLRGQPNFPTKVKFESSTNNGEYEVVSVKSDTEAILSGSFVNESNLKYAVVGTFTPGYQVPSENKMIYEYDSYSIETIDSTEAPIVDSNHFILASVEFDSLGVMSVNDERASYMFNQEYSETSENTGENKLVSLLAATLVGGVDSVRAKAADIELILEHGYSVNSYEWNITADYNIFKITSGTCNFIGSKAIPDGMFNHWILLNRANMKYVEVERSVGNQLYISTMNSDITKGSNDFVVVPKFSEVEYEVTLSSNVSIPSVPFYFKNSISNVFTRARFYSVFPSFGGNDNVTVKIRYRFIDDTGKKYPFYELSVAPFVNINGETETLAESDFVINMSAIEPEAEKRNYS